MFAGLLPTPPASASNSCRLLASRSATYFPQNLDGEHGASTESVAVCCGWMAVFVGSCFVGVDNVAVEASAVGEPRWGAALAIEVAFGVHGGVTACTVHTYNINSCGDSYYWPGLKLSTLSCGDEGLNAMKDVCRFTCVRALPA